MTARQIARGEEQNVARRIRRRRQLGGLRGGPRVRELQSDREHPREQRDADGQDSKSMTGSIAVPVALRRRRQPPSSTGSTATVVADRQKGRFVDPDDFGKLSCYMSPRRRGAVRTPTATQATFALRRCMRTPATIADDDSPGLVVAAGRLRVRCEQGRRSSGRERLPPRYATQDLAR